VPACVVPQSCGSKVIVSDCINRKAHETISFTADQPPLHVRQLLNILHHGSEQIVRSRRDARRTYRFVWLVEGTVCPGAFVRPRQLFALGQYLPHDAFGDLVTNVWEYK
jgi:hypothetical protein